MQEFEAVSATHKKGHQKILAFCEKAKAQGIQWCWIDTCGIDKMSSAELSEAINSMYAWYEKSKVCMVYLEDVEAQVQTDGSILYPDFRRSCWFARGWTLQELIAPRNVDFYSTDWKYIGDKQRMAHRLSSITHVDKHVLLGSMPVRTSSVAKIISWASHRATTRKEDIAYCMIRLFGIHMPLLYGEGDRAYIRLQEEILKQSSDQSLFAWNPLLCEKSIPSLPSGISLCGIFAPSPVCFAGAGDVTPLTGYWDTESTFTNRGVRLRMPLTYDIESQCFLGILSCGSQPDFQDVAIQFYSASNTLEDLDHLVRLCTPIKLGNWSNDPHIQFRTVYLVTDSALWQIHHFGPRYLKTEYEFHILLPDDLRSLCEVGKLGIYPREARVAKPSVGFAENGKVKRITVVNPANTSNRAVAIVIPTTLSMDLAVDVGFHTLPNGLLDVQNPWAVINAVSKDGPSDYSIQDVRRPSLLATEYCLAIFAFVWKLFNKSGG